MTNTMDKALAIFTFSPVQSFISEARRAEDLFNGSAILSRLAYAAAEAIGQQNLIYPLSISPDDMPNKLVAELNMDEAEQTLQKAEDALIGEWRKIAADARKRANLDSDPVWMSIWQRQVIQRPPWQVFWVVVPRSADYTADYREASRLLEGVKHARLFEQSEEEGAKDSLSGQRSALHTQNTSPKCYWKEMAKKGHIPASRLKPEGKERLDGIGLVKRFAELKQNRQFPSTSTVAGWDFYQLARQKDPGALQAHRQVLDDLDLYRARKEDAIFPYDLDLLFEETLTPERMKDSYNKTFTAEQLKPARQSLRHLYQAVGNIRPSPYYAILLLDGDGVGVKLDKMQDSSKNGRAFHEAFSRGLADFAGKTAKEIVLEEKGGFLIYNGGDDVLLFASLQNAIPLAVKLTGAYKKAQEGVVHATLSGAVLFAHHLSPLSRVLADLRSAEQYAKSVKADDWGNKDMLCVALSKRGDEPLRARSSPDQLAKFDSNWVEPFRKDRLAGGLPYMLKDDLRIAENLEPQAVQALVTYRFKRQAEEGFGEKAAELADQWVKWVEDIRNKLETTDPGRTAIEEGINWLVIARFLAQGGRE